MSLIHQVLQDIDNRESRADPSNTGFATEKNRSNHGFVWVAVFSVAGVMSFALMRPDIFNLNLLFGGGQPPFVDTSEKKVGTEAMGTMNTAPVTEDVLPLNLIPAQVTVAEQKPETVIVSRSPQISPERVPVNASAAKTMTAVDSSRTAKVTPASQTSAVVAPVRKADSVAVKSPVTEPVISVSTGKSSSVSKPAPGKVVVTSKEKTASDLYKKAIANYQAGDYTTTLSLLNQALMRSYEPEYLTLKARVYVDQGALEQFLDIYRSNSTLEDPTWLKVVAPGLHIFRLYPQAASHYQKLTVLYPGQVEWAMARFQVLKDSGDFRGASAELTRMEKNYKLSAEQADWVSYQKKRMI